MIYLAIAPAGWGKSHWLHTHGGAAVIDCTHASHKTILLACANDDTLSRASIAEIIAALTALPPTTIHLDNVDRTSPKIMYSLLTLSNAGHIIYATATERKKCAVITDRQAAVIIEIPRPPLRAIIPADIPPRTAAKIAQLATTPAAIINLSAAARAGAPLPPPPATNIYPIIIIVTLAAIALWRQSAHATPAIIALIGGTAYWLRRQLWKAK